MMSYVALAVAVVAGALVGWWVRGSRQGTERRILEELLTRKVRLAESDREDAIAAMNRIRLDAQGVQDRIDADADRIAALEASLEAGAKKAREVSALVEERDRELARTRKDAAAQREASERAARGAVASEEERTRLAAELEEARETLAGRDADLERARIDAEEAAARIEEVRAEVAASATARSRTASELAAARAESEERGREIEEISGLRREASSEIAVLQSEIARLEAEVAFVREAGGTSLADLERVRADLAERSKEAEALTRRVSEIPSLEERLAERDAVLAVREGLLVSRDGTIEELRRTSAGELAELRQASERELSGLRQASERELSELRRISQDELAAVRSELEERLEKERAKVAKSEPAAPRLAEELAASQRELDERKAHLASLASSHKAAQLKVERLNASIETLGDKLADRDLKLKDAQGLQRERATEVKALQAELKRQAKKAESAGRNGSAARRPAARVSRAGKRGR